MWEPGMTWHLVIGPSMLVILTDEVLKMRTSSINCR